MENLTRYERLLDAIENSDVLYAESDSVIAPAQSTRFGDNTHGITFNESAVETAAERHVALAHEKAHCETSSFYNFNSPRLEYEVNEAKAWRRTIKDALTLEELLGALPKFTYADGVDIYELSEHFTLPPWFVEKTLEYHYQQGERW